MSRARQWRYKEAARRAARQRRLQPAAGRCAQLREGGAVQFPGFCCDTFQGHTCDRPAGHDGPHTCACYLTWWEGTPWLADSSGS